MPIAASIYGLAASEKLPVHRLQQFATGADCHDTRPGESIEPALVGSAVHFPTPSCQHYVDTPEIARQERAPPSTETKRWQLL